MPVRKAFCTPLSLVYRLGDNWSSPPDKKNKRTVGTSMKVAREDASGMRFKRLTLSCQQRRRRLIEVGGDEM